MTEAFDAALARGETAAPGFRTWAEERGLTVWDWPPLDNPTQLLRHGFTQGARVGAHDRPAGTEGRTQFALANFGVGANALGPGDAYWYTVALVNLPSSLGVAKRILCHDRGLSELERSNPDREREIIVLDDQAVRLESDAFLARYTLATDHDQDNLHAWELFSPALIEWLTNHAPEEFSFELQDGALCCFVPGVTDDAARLDELAAATARVVDEVNDVVAGKDSLAATAPLAAVAGSRGEIVDRELALREFAEPPDSVRAAAAAFARLPVFIGRRSWKLGAEAFFRAYAASIGLEPIEISTFMATNPDATIFGDVAQAARGPLPGADVACHFVLTEAEAFGSTFGYVALFAATVRGDDLRDLTDDAEVEATKSDRYIWFDEGVRVCAWCPDGGARRRRRQDLDEFIARASPILARLVTDG